MTIDERNQKYAAQTIAEAQGVIHIRNGSSKRETKRLQELLKVPGVTPATTIAEARVLLSKNPPKKSKS